MARTAVIAGTATTVSNRVSRRQANKWAAEDQQQYAEQQAAPPPQAAPAAPTESRVDKLKELAALKDAGHPHRRGVRLREGTHPRQLRPDMVSLDGGDFRMGSADRWAYPGDGEGPVRRVRVDPFEIAPHAVSNAEFAAFAEATGHVSEAERFGWSFVFGGLLPDDFPLTRGVASAPWWRQVEGADWRHPEGPQSDIGRPHGPPRGPRELERRRRPTAPGPASACRPRPSGSTRPAAGSRARCSPGATSWSPAASTA